MDNFQIERAKIGDLDSIWQIILYAKESRKRDGSTQWQNGYPFRETILEDIKQGNAYVMRNEEGIQVYVAVIFGKEQAYENIEGKWLSDGDYCAVHRLAISETMKGKGLAQKMLQEVENIAKENQVLSIKIDTNFDNIPMLKIIEKLGYAYCGEVYQNNEPRKAFEKLLKD